MATDCPQLSANAQKIFEKIKRFFPPDPWKKPQWIQEGRVYDNVWHDLRKYETRRRLIGEQISILGAWVELCAEMHRKDRKDGTLRGFTQQHFTRSMQHRAELLLLLRDLDFQIETLDLVES